MLSDDDGLKNGVKAFLDKIQNPYCISMKSTILGWLSTKIYFRYILTPVRKSNLIPSSGATNWAIGTACHYGNMTFRHYLEGYGRWEREKRSLIINTHLYMTHMSWRLLEFSNDSDDIRQDIEGAYSVGSLKE